MFFTEDEDTQVIAGDRLPFSGGSPRSELEKLFSGFRPEPDGAPTDPEPGRWREDALHCPKCKEAYREGEDAYCRYCGQKRTGETVSWYEPSPNEVNDIYGPMPATVYYRCPGCGERWESSNWDMQHFCPRCGHAVSGREGVTMLALVDEVGNRIPLREEYSFPADRELCIGRGGAGREFLQDPFISRSHLLVRFPRAAKGIEIVDISQNGTLLNGRALKKNVPARMEPGDTIELGDVPLTLRWIEIENE